MEKKRALSMPALPQSHIGHTFDMQAIEKRCRIRAVVYRRRHGYGQADGLLQSNYYPIPRRIEVLNSDDSRSHHCTVDEAWEQVRSNNAKWLNARQIQLKADRFLKVTWEPKMSGNYIVMQVVS